MLNDIGQFSGSEGDVRPGGQHVPHAELALFVESFLQWLARKREREEREADAVSMSLVPPREWGSDTLR